MKNNKLVDGYYHIVSKVDGRLIDIDAMRINENGACAQLFDSIGRENQQWKLELIEEPFYKLKCRESGKFLDIISMGVVNGAQLHQWEKSDVDSQLWKLVETKDGYYKLISKLSNKAIDSSLYSGNGVRMHLWDDLDTDTQLWKLELKEKINIPKPKIKNDTNVKPTTTTKQASKPKKAVAVPVKKRATVKKGQSVSKTIKNNNKKRSSK